MTEFEEKCLAEMAEIVGALGKVLAKLEKLDRLATIELELNQTSDVYLRSIEHSCKEIYLELPGKGNWDFKCRGSHGSSSSFF
jgi:hypothetical protein